MASSCHIFLLYKLNHLNHTSTYHNNKITTWFSLKGSLGCPNPTWPGSVIIKTIWNMIPKEIMNIWLASGWDSLKHSQVLLHNGFNALQKLEKITCCPDWTSMPLICLWGKIEALGNLTDLPAIVKHLRPLQQRYPLTISLLMFISW